VKKTLFAFAFAVFISAAFGEDLKLLNFADYLYGSGDYYRAISEYKRFIYYEPEAKSDGRAAYMIGMSYMGAEKWDGAIDAFESAEKKYGGETAGISLLAESICYTNKKDYAYSDMLLSRLDSGYNNPAESDISAYARGFNLIYEKKWDDARGMMLKVSGSGGDEIRNSAVSIAAMLEKSSGIEQKSQVLSVLFAAVVPGTGYYYCGRWADGLFAMIFNAYFLYNTYYSFSKNDNLMKVIYGVPGAVFYFSNIYGSAVAANKFNNDETDNFISSIEAKKSGILSIKF
jgi:tetratricopeptide (TPR) repeat protein